MQGSDHDIFILRDSSSSASSLSYSRADVLLAAVEMCSSTDLSRFLLPVMTRSA